MNVKSFVEIKEQEIKSDTIVFTKKTQLWCKLPYTDHPHGCINYDKNDCCPPKATFDQKIVFIYERFRLIYAIFDVKTYVTQLKKKWDEEHKTYTEKKLRNLLWWQNSIKKMLKDYIKNNYYLQYNNRFHLYGCGSGFKDSLFNQFQLKVYSMEAAGIYVFKTLKNNGIDYELKPRNKILQVCLLCYDELYKKDGFY